MLRRIIIPIWIVFILAGHTRTYAMHVEVDDRLTTEVKRFFKPLATLITNNETVPIYNDNVTTDISQLHVSNNNTGVTLYANNIDVNGSKTSFTLPPGFHPNQHSVILAGIHRDKDSFFIPYTTIYGITLISVLRMGLIPEQRESYFKHFLRRMWKFR